jgi:hypothetical protein
MVKFLNIFIFLVFCSGCRSYNVGEGYSPEKFNQLNKGIAFFAITEGICSLSFEIKKLESEKVITSRQVKSNTIYSVDSNEGFMIDGGPSYTTKNMLFLDPGLYYIDYISLRTSRSFLTSTTTSRWFPSPGIDDGVIKYGAFEILPNQVHFIGNLVYSEKSNSFRLDIDRRIIDKQLNNSKYNHLFDSMKIGKFYKSGSIVYKDKNGDYKVFRKEELNQVNEEIIKRNKLN